MVIKSPLAHGLPVPDWHDKLEDLQDYSDSDLQTEQSSGSEQCEEWMTFADFSQSNNLSDPEASSLNNDNSICWQTTSYPYTSQQIAEMPSWINSKKQTYIYQP